jgi:hypothetical protein
MKVSRLTICDWHLDGRKDTVVERPSWSDIESAIRALNNSNLNDIHLELEGQSDCFLTVGGGNGQYMVSGSVDAEFFPTLVDVSIPEEPHVDLIVGGQLGDYPGCYVVSLERALEATRSVAENGAFLPEVGWQNV